MVKPPREESYASKQKAMVNYPKLKSQRSNKENKEDKEEKFQLERPTTYTVEPSVDDLKLVIGSAKELENPKARTELMSVIQKFLESKRREAWREGCEGGEEEERPEKYQQYPGHVNV